MIKIILGLFTFAFIVSAVIFAYEAKHAPTIPDEEDF
jgi:hypothetical protein